MKITNVIWQLICIFAVQLRKLALFVVAWLALLGSNSLTAQVLMSGGESPVGSAIGAQDSTEHEHQAKPRILPSFQGRNLHSYGIDTFKTIDTSFGMLQRYHPLLNQGKFYVDLGVVGSPTKVLTIEPFHAAGPSSGFDLYKEFNLTPNNVPVYNAKTPFSNFSYVQGAGAILLKALHTQNLSPTWNITAMVNSYQVTKQFLDFNQTKYGSLHRGVYLGSHYRNQKGNYANSIEFTWNRSRRNEFGGGDSASFGEGLNFDLFKKRMPVDLRKTELVFTPLLYGANTRYRNHAHSFLQTLKVINGIRVFHEFKHQKEEYYYSDESVSISETKNVYDTLNRNLYLFQTNAFVDSNAYVNYSNHVGFFTDLKSNSKLPLMFKGYASYSGVYNGNLWGTRLVNNSLGVHGELQMDPYETRKWQGNAHADLFIGGINSGDYYLEGNLSSIILKKLKLNAGIKSQLTEAPLYLRQYFSNYYYWNNVFQKILTNEINGAVQFNSSADKLFARASIQTGTSSNAIYFDVTQKPKQLNSVLAYFIFKLNYKFNFRKFGIEQIWQVQSNNQSNFLPVPNLGNITGIYYQSRWFKKVLKVKLGLDFIWYSSVNAYSYAAETGAFSISKSKVKLGNYPQFDAYLNGEIKTLQFFVKFEHLNYGIYNYGFNNSTISTLNYGRESFLMRLGINWRFFN